MPLQASIPEVTMPITQSQSTARPATGSPPHRLSCPTNMGLQQAHEVEPRGTVLVALSHSGSPLECCQWLQDQDHMQCRCPQSSSTATPPTQEQDHQSRELAGRGRTGWDPGASAQAHSPGHLADGILLVTFSSTLPGRKGASGLTCVRAPQASKSTSKEQQL